jgi:formate hydrogenlyase subunit 6/NADH:ubiquinone oxidoreductase subunit I
LKFKELNKGENSMPNIKTVVEVFKSFLNPITTKFPTSSPDHLTEGFKGKVQLNQETCIGCGACLQVCPSFAYKHVHKKGKLYLYYDPGACIFCEMCVDNCPTESLEMSQIFDMSTPANQDTFELIIEHDMQLCKVCKDPFATIKHLDWIQKKLNEVSIINGNRGKIIHDEFEITRHYCPKCRKIKARELDLDVKKLY